MSTLLTPMFNMSYDKYSWKETQPGHWQRSTDEVEHFYFALAKLFEGSRRMFFAMTGHLVVIANPIASLSKDDAENRLDAALRSGWIALRQQHPTVASRVFPENGSGSSIKVYKALQKPEDIDSWVKETLVMVPEIATGEDWANSDPPAPSAPKLFVLKPAGTSLRRDLVFRSPHEIVDGIGTLQMLNRLVSNISEAYDRGGAAKLVTELGSETRNLTPPYRIAANVPVELSPEQMLRMERMNAQKLAASKGSDSVPVLAIPYKKGETIPGRHQRAYLWLSEDQTTSIAKSCKAAGATVTHAFHAAIAMTVRDLQQPPVTNARVGQYVNYILRNERKSCTEPYNSPDHCVSVYHSVSGQALVIDLDLSFAGQQETRAPSEVAAEFFDILSKIRDFYHEVRDDSDHYALASSFWAAGIPSLPDDGSIPPVPPPKTTPTASISSMGKVDAIIQHTQGNIEVYDPWVTGEELGNGFGAFLGTFRGKLCLSAAYNDAWHDKEEAVAFLERCRDIVLESLGSA
jgi:hypothetical protein